MSRNNEPIEREEHPEPDEPVHPVPDDEPLPVPIEEPDDGDRAPIDEHSDRRTLIVSANELIKLRECLRWG